MFTYSLRSSFFGLFWILTSFLPLNSCKNRSFNLATPKATLEFSEAARHEAISNADVWGTPWDGTSSYEDVVRSDEELIESISTRDVVAGPMDPTWNPTGSAALSKVACSFDESIANPAKPPGGRTAKFGCKLNNETRSRKIKYDPVYSSPFADVTSNAGVYGEVFATRLMWALGFPTDNAYPLQVSCFNCPSDPWLWLRKHAGNLDLIDFQMSQVSKAALVRGEVETRLNRKLFFPAVVETLAFGSEILLDSHLPKRGIWGDGSPAEGWGFNEIVTQDSLSENPQKARRQRVQRDALMLFMAFLMHADSKPDNQRLVCYDKDKERGKSVQTCTTPVMIVGDPGSILGTGWAPFMSLRKGRNPLEWAKMAAEEWSQYSAWLDGNSTHCKIKVNNNLSGTLTTQKISKAGADFLSRLISKLSDQQIKDVVRVANLDLAAGGAKKVVVNADQSDFTVQDNPEGNTQADWFEAIRFKLDRDILNHKCLD